MSAAPQTNATVLREGYERFNRGELEWVFGQVHPEVVWEDADEMPDARTYRGFEEVRRFMESFGRHWETLRFEPQRLVEEGDRVLVDVRVVGRGRVSGAEVDARLTHVFDMRELKVIRVRTFFDRDQAAAALSA
jgi:uncharacterized protein